MENQPITLHSMVKPKMQHSLLQLLTKPIDSGDRCSKKRLRATKFHGMLRKIFQANDFTNLICFSSHFEAQPPV